MYVHRPEKCTYKFLGLPLAVYVHRVLDCTYRKRTEGETEMTNIERIAELLKSVATEDEIMNLVEGVRTEIRDDMKEDLIIDLKDWNQDEAVAIIKENY
jgi:hypothetical protein